MQYYTVFLLSLLLLLLDLSSTGFLALKSDQEVCSAINCSHYANSTSFLLHGLYSYSFLTSQLDFFLPSLFRLVILAAGLLGVAKNRQHGPEMVKSIGQSIFCLYLILFMASPLKLLALCEKLFNLRQLRYFWACYVMNHLWSVLGFVFWRYLLTRVQPAQVLPVHLATNGTARMDDDCENLIGNVQETTEDAGDNSGENQTKSETDEKDKKEKLSLKDSTSNLKRLGKYCLKEWHWYLSGLTFLILYSSSENFLYEICFKVKIESMFCLLGLVNH